MCAPAWANRSSPASTACRAKTSRQFFKSPRRYLLAGFSVTMTLPAGPASRVVRRPHARREMGGTRRARVERNADEARPDPDGLTPLIRRRHGRSAARDPPAARPGMEPMSGPSRARSSPKRPWRHHLQHAPRPFHGHLDQPRSWERSPLRPACPSRAGSITQVMPIKRVLVTADLQAVQELKLGSRHRFPRRTLRPLPARHALRLRWFPRPARAVAANPSPSASTPNSPMAAGTSVPSRASPRPTTNSSSRPTAAFPRWRSGARGARWSGAMQAAGWHLPNGRNAAIRQVWPRVFRPGSAPDEAHPRPGGCQRPARNGLRVARASDHAQPEPRRRAPLPARVRATPAERPAAQDLAVTSGAEGPLRGEFAALGASVRVVDTSSLLAATSAAELRRHLARLASQVKLADAGLVVANTLSAWWGVHLAHAAGRPTLFYIHESTSPNGFFRGLLPAPVLGRGGKRFPARQPRLVPD